MSNRFRRLSFELKLATGCAAIVLLSGACHGSSGEPAKSEQAMAPLPSITDEPVAHASTAASVEPPVAAMPGPSEVPVDRTGDAPAEAVLPDDFDGLIRLARELGPTDSDGAMAALERARAKKPASIMPDIESARVMLAAGRPSEARPFAEAAVESDSASSYAWNTLGRVELAEGNVQAALASFERATQENEDNAFAWNNFGLALMSVESYPRAAEALEMATSSDHPTDYMFNNLGMTYEHLGRYDLAAAAYRRGAELGSSRAQANLDRLLEDAPVQAGAVGSSASEEGSDGAEQGGV